MKSAEVRRSISADGLARQIAEGARRGEYAELIGEIVKAAVVARIVDRRK